MTPENGTAQGTSAIADTASRKKVARALVKRRSATPRWRNCS